MAWKIHWKLPSMVAPVLTWVRVNCLPVFSIHFDIPITQFEVEIFKHCLNAHHELPCGNISDQHVNTKVIWCVFMWNYLACAFISFNFPYHSITTLLMFSHNNLCHPLLHWRLYLEKMFLLSHPTGFVESFVTHCRASQLAMRRRHVSSHSSRKQKVWSREFFEVDMTLLNVFSMGFSPHGYVKSI